MTPFRLAVLDLTRRRVTTLIALIGIAAAVASSGVLLKCHLLAAARFSTIATGPDAVIGAKAGDLDLLLGSLDLEGAFPGFLPQALWQSLKDRRPVHFQDGQTSQPSFIRDVVPFLYGGRWGDFRIIGTDERFLEHAAGGAPASLPQGRWAAAAGEVVLGAEVARHRLARVGDTITCDTWQGGDTHPSTTFPLQVVGIMGTTGMAWDRALFTTVPQAQSVLQGGDGRDGDEHHPWGTATLHYMLVYLETDGFGRLEELVNRRTVAQAISVPAARARLTALTGVGHEIGFLIISAIMVLGGLCVAATMVTRFDAMNVQMAVLRALGHGRGAILAWLVWEGALLGGAGCILGGIIDALAFPWIRSLLGSALPAAHLVASPFHQSAPVWCAAIAATLAAMAIPIGRMLRQDLRASLHG